ncbi:hypothetical protein OSTOST_21182, partial [Ostertagia ostertagi]
MSTNEQEVETFAKNIWSYIMNFYPDGPKPFLKMDVLVTLLTRTAAILEKEPSVLELTGEVTVMGPIYGEGDSLITLLSLVGMPPQKTFLFLGCYFGLGFAPLESLMLLFCMKCLFPTKVYLLKGHLEEPASIK